MVAEVEVCSGVDSLELLETEWEVKLDISSGIGIMSEFLVIVKTIVLSTHTEVHVPVKTCLLPIFEEVHLSTRLAEELHFHLLELSHTENELTGNDLISECLTYLCYTERNLHTTCFLHVKILHEDTLSGFRTEINLVISVTCIADLSAEHQVKLTNICPVCSTRNRADNTAIEDNLLILIQVICLLCCYIS